MVLILNVGFVLLDGYGLKEGDVVLKEMGVIMLIYNVS